MKANKRIYLYLFYIIVGVSLFTLGCLELIDEFWSGMGGALIAVAILRLVRERRLYANPEYREKMEIAESDERNSFIRLKAWAWTGYLQILILGTAVIVLKIMGLDLWSSAASYGVCLILILYYVTWFVLRKKY